MQSLMKKVITLHILGECTASVLVDFEVTIRDMGQYRFETKFLLKKMAALSKDLHTCLTTQTNQDGAVFEDVMLMANEFKNAIYEMMHIEDIKQKTLEELKEELKNEVSSMKKKELLDQSADIPSQLAEMKLSLSEKTVQVSQNELIVEKEVE
jgi:hypothetical protein